MSANTDPPSSRSAGSRDTPGRPPSRSGESANRGASSGQPAGASLRPDAREAPGNASADSAGTVAATAAISPASRRKPRLSLFIATASGLGCLPKAPGTWGSLGGLALAVLPFWAWTASMIVWAKRQGDVAFLVPRNGMDVLLWCQIGLAVLIGVIGVLSATRAARFWALKDPQGVVIDEVSGQHLSLLLGCVLPVRRSIPALPANFGLGLVTLHSALNWKYLLLGFILFRVFDIWKPFPARQAEALPGGWGIMTDDWIAGIYAGLGLWVARALGL